MQLYGVHCNCSHIDLKCQESWALAHTPHTPHLFATGSSDGSVLLRSVERCSTGRSSQNKQQEQSVPLAHSGDLFHLSLSLLHNNPNSVSGREEAAFYRAPPHSTALCTSREGVRNAVSHSLKWPLASWSLPVLTTCVYS